MPVNISPGVYSSFHELSTYVQEVPSSTGFIAFFSDKGPDNILTPVYNVNKFIRLYGEPNYLKYGTRFGGGHLVAYSFMQASPKMYALRVLPEDAKTSNKLFFLVLEKPATITSDDFQVRIAYNSNGVLPNQGGVTFTNPHGNFISNQLLERLFWYAEINTNDPNVKLIFNKARLMNYILDGARTYPNAVAILYTTVNNNDIPSGSYVVNEDFEIGISGTGKIDVSGSLQTGKVYLHVDRPQVVLLDISVDVERPENVDINSIISYIKGNWRPKYILDNYVLEIGSQIDQNTFRVSIRRRLAKERGIEKVALLVPSAAGNNVYLVTITNGQFNFNPAPNNINVVNPLKNYGTVINDGQTSAIFNLRVDDSDPANITLVWKRDSSSVDDSWNSTFDSIIPLFAFYGKHRGKYYDNYRVQFLQIENEEDRFLLNIYEKDKKGNENLNNEFYVSFLENAKDKSGETIYIKNIVDRFSDDVIFVDYKESRTDLIHGFYNKLTRYGIIPQARIVEDTSEITESGWYFIKSNATLSRSPVGIEVSQFQNYLGSIIFVRTDGSSLNGPNIVFGVPTTQFEVLTYLGGIFLFQRDTVEQKYTIVSSSRTLYDGDEPDSFIILDGINDYTNETGVNLAKGSDGSLFQSNGQINETIAKQLLVNAYLGNIDEMVKNTEFVWIDVVLDGGYPTDVKNAIVQLVHEIRRDCVALLDNGDNRSVEESLRRRYTEHSWNSSFVAIYEPYIQIYDVFSGRDIWITPIYAVARLLALNDRINEIWYAVAGYTRGVSNVIKALRFTPSEISERDDLYLAQVNPFVTFRDGNVLWGQLTSYKKPSNFQDLNIMRMVLYIERALRNFCKYFIFDFIDDITKQNILVGIVGFLEDIKRRRGLYDYSVNVHADEYAIMRKTLYVDVELKPTKVLEKIKLNFYL